MVYSRLILSSSTVSNGVSNNQVAAPLSTTTAFLSSSVQVSRQISVGLELEKSIQGDSAQRLSLLANWQVTPQARVNLRHETSTNMGINADRGRESSTWAIGVANGFNSESVGRGDVYSEYRVHEGYSLRSGELASGLRTSVNLSDEWRLALGGERIYGLYSAGTRSNAITTGLEYLGSSDWRGSTRLEWRNGLHAGSVGGSQSWLHSVSLARRLSQDWTLLARNYWASTDDHLVPGKQSQERFQVGLAYRGPAPTGLDLVSKLEFRNESNGEISGGESRRIFIGSAHANWHPIRPLWLSLRLAGKAVTENLQSHASKFNATLIGARVTYDLTSKLDLSGMAQVMNGQGSSQYALGVELGYAMARNMYVGLGYNVSGFVDRDLTGDEYTAKGAFLRLRYKFDEDSFPFLKSGIKADTKAIR